MISLKPNAQRAKAAILLVYIVMALDVLSAVSGVMQYQLLERANGIEGISTEEANANDLREQILGIVYLAANIVAIIMFIRWFRRAYYNLHQLPVSATYTEGWAAGAWFVPILNLFRPYRIMKELYTESCSFLQRREVSFTHLTSTAAVGIWWALWVLSSFIGQFVFRYTMRADTIDEMITSTIAGIIGNIVGVPLALVAAKVIKDYAEAEPLIAAAAAISTEELNTNGDYLNAWSESNTAGFQADNTLTPQ